MVLFIIFYGGAHSGDCLSPLPKQDAPRFYECVISESFSPAMQEGKDGPRGIRACRMLCSLSVSSLPKGGNYD